MVRIDVAAMTSGRSTAVSVPKTKQQDEQRADAADQDLDREAGPLGAADVLEQRVAPRQVHRHGRPGSPPSRRAHPLDVHGRAEPGVCPAGRSPRRSCGGPSTRTRCRVRREVGARPRSGVDRGALGDGGPDPRLLRDVPFEWKTATSGDCSPLPKALQRPLVGLIGRVARDRERLEPASARRVVVKRPNSVTTTHAATTQRRRE